MTPWEMERETELKKKSKEETSPRRSTSGKVRDKMRDLTKISLTGRLAIAKTSAAEEAADKVVEEPKKRSLKKAGVKAIDGIKHASSKVKSSIRRKGKCKYEGLCV